MIFIHTLRMIADLSVYFFIAELFAVSLGASSQFIPFLLLSLCYGVLVFLKSKKYHVLYMLLPVAVVFLPGSYTLLLLPPLAYILFLVYRENTSLSWDRQSELFSASIKFFPIAGISICLLGYSENFIQYSLPMVFVSWASSVFLMRMLRHTPAVYLDPRYQRKNILLFIVFLFAAWLFSRDFVFRMAGDVLSFVYMNTIYPVLSIFIWIFLGLLRIVMYIFSWFRFGEIKFEENHLSGGEMGPSFKDALIVGDHVATTQSILTIIAIAVLFAGAFYFFRWLALHNGEEIFAGSGFDMVRTGGMAKQKKERATTTALQIRRQYRIFLKLYKEHGGKIASSFTSEDILNNSAKVMPGISAALLEEVREIYINARYGGVATKTDLKRIKQINKELSTTINQ